MSDVTEELVRSLMDTRGQSAAAEATAVAAAAAAAVITSHRPGPRSPMRSGPTPPPHAAPSPRDAAAAPPNPASSSRPSQACALQHLMAEPLGATRPLSASSRSSLRPRSGGDSGQATAGAAAATATARTLAAAGAGSDGGAHPVTPVKPRPAPPPAGSTQAGKVTVLSRVEVPSPQQHLALPGQTDGSWGPQQQAGGRGLSGFPASSPAGPAPQEEGSFRSRPVHRVSGDSSQHHHQQQQQQHLSVRPQAPQAGTGTGTGTSTRPSERSTSSNAGMTDSPGQAAAGRQAAASHSGPPVPEGSAEGATTGRGKRGSGGWMDAGTGASPEFSAAALPSRSPRTSSSSGFAAAPGPGQSPAGTRHAGSRHHPSTSQPGTPQPQPQPPQTSQQPPLAQESSQQSQLSRPPHSPPSLSPPQHPPASQQHSHGPLHPHGGSSAAAARAVRFSSRDGPPGTSVTGAEAPLQPPQQAAGMGAPLQPPRRVSDSASSHAGPKPPVPGAGPSPAGTVAGPGTGSRRPSEDGLGAAVRRPGNGVSSDGLAPAHWVSGGHAQGPSTGVPSGPQDSAAAAVGGGAPGGRAHPSLAAGLAPAPSSSADAGPGAGTVGHRGVPGGGGGGGGGGGHHGHHHHHHQHHKNGAEAAGPPIRRAGELAPLSLPGGLDTSLREALARAAAANVSVLASGELLPEPDFGYARIVAQHHAQEAKRQQLAATAPHGGNGRSSGSGSLPPGTPQAAEPPARRPSLRAVPDSAAALRGGGGGGGPHRAGGSSGNLEGMAAANGESSPPSSSPNRPPLPPTKVHSRRSVLKHSRSYGSGGGDGEGSAYSSSAPPGQPSYPHPQPGGSLLRRHSKSASARSLTRNSTNTSARSGATAAATEDYSDDPDSPLPLSVGQSTFPGATTFSGAAAAAGGADGLDLDGAEGSDGAPRRDLRLEENVDVRIHCVTFNMGGVMPPAAALPESLFSGSYLSPDSIADAPHVYVFATQESGPLADWEAAVAAHLGRRYKHVATESLMSIHIVLFAVRSLAPYIKDVRTSSVATGVGNVLGNKGGVAVTFALLGVQVLVVGAHFAAHDQNVERRNADYHRICAGLFASNGSPSTANTTASGQAKPGGPASPARLGRSTSNVPDGSPSRTAACATPPRPSRSGYNVSQGPTLSRFSRGPAAVGATAAAAAAVAAVDSDASNGGGGGGGPPARALTRTLSNSSVSSCVSTASAYPGASNAPSEAPSRLRTPSFWSGISFTTAQRHSNALLAHFDVVLWMGDLNYRIAGTPEVVKYAMDQGLDEVLRANDQLLNQQKKGKVLQGFQEMPISFAPTFKLTPGTDQYDLKRTPAWTDRVLYLANADPLFADLRPLYYMSVPELRSSDHKPVIAGFELSICPQRAGTSHQARQRGCSIM